MMQKRIASFRYAINGFKRVVRSEYNMRIHLGAAAIAVIASFILHLNIIEWIFVVLSIGLVLSAEIANTIVEEYLDAYHPEYNSTVGAIKDMSAAAVLVIALVAAIIGSIIFIPKILFVL